MAVLILLALPVAGRDYTVEFGVGMPKQTGYLQTPAGGMPGTASSKRPTLAETGLDGGHYRWLAASVDFGAMARRADDGSEPRVHLRFRMRYSTVGDNAGTVLDNAFTIRGGVFDVGDSVQSRVSFDGLRLALTALFDLTPDLSAELGAEVGWTAFEFTMLGERHRSERAYHVNTVGLVGAVTKEFGNGWRLGARLAALPAIDGTGSRYALETRLGRDLSSRIGVAIGARLERFNYDDAHKQELPNRLRVTRRVVPALSATLRL